MFAYELFRDSEMFFQEDSSASGAEQQRWVPAATEQRWLPLDSSAVASTRTNVRWLPLRQECRHAPPERVQMVHNLAGMADWGVLATRGAAQRWQTGTVLNLRTLSSQKCEAVPRKARI